MTLHPESRLTVVGEPYFDGRRSFVPVRCECGQRLTVRLDHVRSRNTLSCGCAHRDIASRTSFRHGMHGTRTYVTWNMMTQRCGNPKNPYFHYYGGRGITVCKRWLKFENFLADMGERPEGMTLDRKNNDKGYSKSNCRWATRAEQARNRRVVKK